MGLFKKNTYFKYYQRIQLQKERMKKIIKIHILEKNKTLIGYGAPAKVTTFCYAFDLSQKDIRAIVDDNNLKQGKLTPGKNIKIIKFKELYKIKFNYIIILAWNFAKPIIDKLKNSFKGKKFKIIVPFPNIKII
jgi:hypothetical protein